MVNPYKYVVRGDTLKNDVEHRVIMEHHIGRKLGFNEVVHHINGDRKDNRIENLEIMSRSEHSRMHHKSPEYIKLTCAHCGREFEKYMREYRYAVKHGRTEFCCCKQCSGKHNYAKGVKPPLNKAKVN